MGDSGLCVVMVSRRCLSKTLSGLHNKEIGLYEEGSAGVLLDLSMGIILFVFKCLTCYCEL